MLEAQRAAGVKGRGAHAGGVPLRERVARIGAGLSGRHIGEGAGAVKGQRGVLLAKHTGQHDNAVQTGGGASQIVAAAGAEEQPQRVEPVGVGLVHGGPRGDAYAQRQDQCQSQRKRAHTFFTSRHKFQLPLSIESSHPPLFCCPYDTPNSIPRFRILPP